MIKKVLGALVASVAVLVLALGVGAAPASASTVFGCADVRVCLYNWINYNNGGGALAFSRSTMINAPNRCISLNGRIYNGANISAYDTASSIVVNDMGYTGDYLRFYEWVGCNGNSFSVSLSNGQLDLFPNLSTLGFNDTIASIGYNT